MKLSGRETECWLAGCGPGGVAFFAGEQVMVHTRDNRVCAGTIVLLTELEPEPRYLIEIGRGHFLQAAQSALAKA